MSEQRDSGTPASPAGGAALRRALGRWDLTAIGINQVIGGAIFLMPSQVAAQIGGWSPIAFLLAGLASLLVALCFAEVGSRFEGTGGPYLYTRAAFGRFVAFEVGWMQWFTRVTSLASVANGIALALGSYAPEAATGAGRVLLVTAIIATLAWINVRGIRESAWVVNALTIGKLVPLGLFLAFGLARLDPARVGPLPAITTEQAASAALLLVFVFGGFDVIPVPAGEARDPRRHVPFALVMTVLVVTVLFTLTQLVSTATLPGLAASRTPVADAARVTMGAAGALLVAAGSILSMVGNNAGGVLTGSRMVFALAEHGDLPRALARVHPHYRTPSNAILFTAGVALVLAASGSFVALAAASAVARLVTYAGTCAATLQLRRPRRAGSVAPATFVPPLGPVVPVLAVLISLAILISASRLRILAGVAALGAGAVLFLMANRGAAGVSPMGSAGVGGS